MSAVLILPENTKGRDFVIGDIHGAFDMLEKALAAAQFDATRDRLISIGDLIDRGPESRRCAELLRQPWFFAVRGNHEDMFLDIVRADGTFDENKAAWNIRNGMGWIFDETPEMLSALRAEIARMPLALEIPTDRGTVGFVHAEVPAGLDWETFKNKLAAGDEGVTEKALWGRDRIQAGDTSGVAGIDRLFFGHTPQAGGPQRLGNCYYIDTGAVFRLLKGDADFFLTLSDIRADSAIIPGPGAREKVITQTPPKPKKFGAY